MGTFTQEIEVSGPSGEEYSTIEAKVDTGATYSMLPASFLSRFGVIPEPESMEFTLANGEKQRMQVGNAWFRVNGVVRPSPVVFGPEGRMLFGATTLQAFGLIADTTNHCLVPAPELTL